MARKSRKQRKKNRKQRQQPTPPTAKQPKESETNKEQSQQTTAAKPKEKKPKKEKDAVTSSKNGWEITKIVTILISLVGIVLSNAWSSCSIKQSQEQWTNSGPRFSFVVNNMTGYLAATKTLDSNGSMSVDLHKDGVVEQQFLISNTGRLQANILSLRLGNKQTSVSSMCQYNGVTLKPGESKIIIGKFNTSDFMEGLKAKDVQLGIVTADGLISYAQELDEDKSDPDSIGLAFKHAKKAKSIECKAD